MLKHIEEEDILRCLNFNGIFSAKKIKTKSFKEIKLVLGGNIVGDDVPEKFDEVKPRG